MKAADASWTRSFLEPWFPDCKIFFSYSSYPRSRSSIIIRRRFFVWTVGSAECSPYLVLNRDFFFILWFLLTFFTFFSERKSHTSGGMISFKHVVYVPLFRRPISYESQNRMIDCNWSILQRRRKEEKKKDYLPQMIDMIIKNIII